MTRTIAAAALALTAIAAIPLVAAQERSAPPKPIGIMAQLQGTWTLTTVNGESTAGSGEEILTTITDNKYERTTNGQVFERGTFKIDESKTPMTLDVSITDGPNAGQSLSGILQLNGKTVTAKFAEPGSAARPTDFSTAEGFDVLVMVKKQEKGGAGPSAMIPLR